MIEEHTTPNGFAIVADFYAAKASADAPQSTKDAKAIFEAMSPAERIAAMSGKNNVQRFLDGIGFKELELAPPWDRSTRVHRNGKPA